MADNGVTCSMSRSGNVWDNAAMESFFSSLKTERIARKTYRTRNQAKAEVFDYIERFYNPTRRHSTLTCLPFCAGGGRLAGSRASCMPMAGCSRGPERQSIMTLATDEFIRRFLTHVSPRGFHRIRHYGLLASSSRKTNLARARALLEVAAAPDEEKLQEPVDLRPACPCCGGHMIIIETFERWQQPRAPPDSPMPIPEITP